MQIYQPIVLVVLMALAVSCGPVAQPDQGETQLNTNIAVLNPGMSLDDLKKSAQQGLVIVDPTKLLEKFPEPEPGTVIEDNADRFITDDDGKLRPRLVFNSDINWAGDSERLVSDLQPEIKPESKPLTRVKRCGGGGGGDDDGDAQRARRRNVQRRRRRGRVARRRAQRARKAANGSITQSTTSTTVRKVIGPNGQVISESIVPQQGIVQTQPAVQTVIQQPPVVVRHPQPVAVQHQPVVAQPQVVTQPQVVAQPQVAAAQPSISVTGSVKVN